MVVLQTLILPNVYGEANVFDAGTTLTGGTGTDYLLFHVKQQVVVMVQLLLIVILQAENITITGTAGNNTGGVTVNATSYATAVTVDATALDAEEVDTQRVAQPK